MLAATCFISIFAAQIALAVGTAVLVVRLLVGHAPVLKTALDGPLLAFAVWTLLAAAFSPEPAISHRGARQIVLLVALYLAVDTLSERTPRERVLDAAMLGGLCLAAGALLQFAFLGFDTIDRRPRSFLGHYMTASGLCMSVAVVAAARLALGPPLVRPSRRDLQTVGWLVVALGVWALCRRVDIFAVEAERLFVAGIAIAAAVLVLAEQDRPGLRTLLTSLTLPLCVLALLVSRTRNAWLGVLVGLAAVAVLRAPRLLWLLAAGVLAVLVVRPGFVVDRLTFSDASSVDRYYMWRAGFDMIRDKPVFGQGPGMVQVVYPSYRWPEAPNPRTPHLHDNALQIAAERGLPGLVWWVWWMAVALAAGLQLARSGTADAWAGAAAFAVGAALMAAGLLEYNFGDSEVLMLSLLVSALPFAVRRATTP